MDASDSWMPGDDPYSIYSKSVDMDGAFAAWLQKVDLYAMRFLDITFFDYEEVWCPRDSYIEGMTPLGFIREVIIPSLVCDFGCDFVEELIVDRVLWGNIRDRHL
jgi:hypothetical protein